jgi:quercetin dioxygenase-like cupin family protein
MKTAVLALTTTLTLVGFAQAAPDPKALVYTLPDKIDWKQADPESPQTFILWGDPDKPGPYAMLVRWTPHHMSRPHTHPFDRHIVVLSGTWWVGTGKDYSPDTTTPLPTGTVVTHLANQFHYDGAKDEPAVLEIVGEGPQYDAPKH